MELRCRILRAELTADQLQRREGQGTQGENTPAMPAPAHKFREIESRISAPSIVDFTQTAFKIEGARDSSMAQV
jgi:hypothetical protein